MHFSSKKAYKNTPGGFLLFAICGKIVPVMRACLVNTPKKKWKNENLGTEGNEANEVELRMRPSKCEPPRSCRRESAVPARPKHRLVEQPACGFIRNPPTHVGSYG